jgi:hypothetical protein
MHFISRMPVPLPFQTIHSPVGYVWGLFLKDHHGSFAPGCHIQPPQPRKVALDAQSFSIAEDSSVTGVPHYVI